MDAGSEVTRLLPGVSSVVCPGGRARLTPFPGSPDPDPGNKSSRGANTRLLGPTWADLGAVLLQSSPLAPGAPGPSPFPSVQKCRF